MLVSVLRVLIVLTLVVIHTSSPRSSTSSPRLFFIRLGRKINLYLCRWCRWEIRTTSCTQALFALSIVTIFRIFHRDGFFFGNVTDRYDGECMCSLNSANLMKSRYLNTLV